MEKLITAANLRQFAYCNEHICQKPIKGMVLFFAGLGTGAMINEDTEESVRLAQNGVLYVVPYQNPWAWQNKQNIAFTEEIIDVLFEKYALPADLPIVSTGRSMGGLSAIAYMAYAKRTPVACVANCPVCDLPYHFTEREDLPRTLYSAFYHYEGSLQAALASVSPLDLVEALPTESAYYIFQADNDESVSKTMHSDRFVAKMKETHRVMYYVVPNSGHCDLTEEMQQRYDKHVLRAALGE